jgi:RNA polymerase sigma-70 factor (ECF subfamily)
LTQEFFCRFLERQALQKVERSMGQFRTFLLTCVKNFLINEREAATAKRRGGDNAAISLEAPEAETRYRLESADRLTPEAVFDRRWAFAVIESTMADLHREYASSGNSDLFDDLQGFLPGGRGEISRADLAAKRGITAGAIDVALHRLRQRFGVLLRQEIASTVASKAEVEQEIRYLISVLSS